MTKYNPSNQRIKRTYFDFLKEAQRQSEDSVDAAAKALARFEDDTRHRDFKTFHHAQAIAFKRRLANRDSVVTGERLSKATQHATLAALKKFFQWLAQQPGYKSRLTYTDADYFSLSDKDTRVATARRTRPVPTLAQIKHTLACMPHTTEIEQRNRALVAFALLTGARDSALASVKLKHVDLAAACFHQDAREVKTKFSKTFESFFFPVGDEVLQIVTDWVHHLREQKLWGHDDPMFPKTEIGIGSSQQFEPVGLLREHWSDASPIRKIFKQAFTDAGLPYFNPHSFRSTLAMAGQTMCQTPEQLKAWSQNLGHESVLTTLYSYGTVATNRQAEIIKGLAGGDSARDMRELEAAMSLIRFMRQSGQAVSQS